jgi:hypothetical protein
MTEIAELKILTDSTWLSHFLVLYTYNVESHFL